MRSLGEPDHPAQAPEDRAVLRAFRKICRRWALSLMAALLIVPVVFLSANQIRREGVCFTNIDDIVRAGGYMRALESQDWEKAAAHIDYKKQYNETRALLGMTPEELLPRFISVTIGKREWMATASAAGISPMAWMCSASEKAIRSISPSSFPTARSSIYR